MRKYPKMAIEMEGGELYSIFDIDVNEKNGAQVEQTMRKQGNGVSFGPVSGTVTFQIKEASTAPERDFRGKLRRKEITQLVVKRPSGEREVWEGAFGEVGSKSGLEGATESTVTMVGTIADAP
jgi:hypothetical protein